MELKGRQFEMEEYSILMEALAKLATKLNFAAVTAERQDPASFAGFLRSVSDDLAEVVALSKVGVGEWATLMGEARSRLTEDPDH